MQLLNLLPLRVIVASHDIGRDLRSASGIPFYRNLLIEAELMGQHGASSYAQTALMDECR